MNERIRELALRAGDYVNAVYTGPVRSKTPGKIWEDGQIGWHEQFNEKFAELIVRECLNMCTDSDAALQRIRDGENPPNWKYIRYHASDSEWVEAYMNRFEHYESIANSIDSAGDKIKQHFGVE